MDTRHLLQFVSVARHLSFSRAAEALNTSQPLLSQHIRALERELGFTLFERTKRQVRLTNAGAEYLASITVLLKEFDRCAERGRDTEAGLRGSLTIASVGMAMLTLLPPVVQRFRDERPDLGLHITVMANADIVNTLRARRADLIFASRVEADEEIATEPLWPMPWRVVLPKRHPQARNSAVRLADLSSDTLFIQPHGEEGVGGYDAVLSMCREHGLTPSAIHEVKYGSAVQTLLGLAASGLGIAILPSAYERIDIPLIAFKPIASEKNIPRITAAWRKSLANPLVQSFVAMAKSTVTT